MEDESPSPTPTGDELVQIFAALGNPHRLRILAHLKTKGRTHVSQLAREIGMSRPLLYLHLQRLEACGLVTGTLELSTTDGKAMKYFQVSTFDLHLTPDRIAEAAATLSRNEEAEEK